ncbi:MAG: 3-dehydroquinate synthase [Peptostreptococcaceae bacterium]|nr:3-dehydroquinate synthase [Peptostreptococcaceae bacterium]
MKKITINTSPSYDVIIDDNILNTVNETILEYIEPCKICIITDSTVSSLYANKVKTSLKSSGFLVIKIVFPPGEHSKSLSTYSNILEAVADEGLTKTDCIIALGGGVVGDLAGFVASSYMRGIQYIQIPTTYLAALDSSIGGKTGINLLRGKNLVGTFWNPKLVLCDPTVFNTLPTIRRMDGIAEAIKCAVVTDKSLLGPIKNNSYTYVIERCVSIKKSIVEADQYEESLRQLLSFGHLIGHAIEKLSGYSVSHGHAIAAGMIYEARAAYKMGFTDTDISKDLETILRTLGFTPEVSYTVEELMKYVIMSKRIHKDTIDIVVPIEIGKCKLAKLNMYQLEEYIRVGKE